MPTDIAIEEQTVLTRPPLYGGRKMRPSSPSKAPESNEVFVALVERIRSDKDRAAFAELFRHFAPRVKAFLMKSGKVQCSHNRAPNKELGGNEKCLSASLNKLFF